MLAHEFMYRDKPVAIGIFCKDKETPKDFKAISALSNILSGRHGEPEREYPNICVMGYVKGKEVTHFHATMKELQEVVSKVKEEVEKFVDLIYMQEQEAIVLLNLDFVQVNDSYFEKRKD